MYVSKLFKIGIPILIVLLMLVVVGTGIVLAKEQDGSVSTRPAAYDSSSNGTWAGCWNSGGYCPGPCGRGASNGDNAGNYPPCHGY
jgi:hypothetical protein